MEVDPYHIDEGDFPPHVLAVLGVPDSRADASTPQLIDELYLIAEP